MIKTHDLEQGSPEWHELRAGKYTGSNAHKLLKYGAIDYSLTSGGDFGGNFYTKRGHILEDEAIELYERIKQCTVDRPGFVTNDKWPDCGYSPDGLAGDFVLEVKCFNKKKHLEIYHGEPTLEILAQIYFGMLITEKKKAHLIIYNPEFARKDDPDYNPKLALKIIDVKYRANVLNNFKRILRKEVAHAA